MGFCKEFNARTQDKAGKVLPVVITYYADKSFSFVIKTPPAAIQLMEAATVESAMKLVAGTARSMGITVKGDFPGK